jgi:hypothetical protein
LWEKGEGRCVGDLLEKGDLFQIWGGMGARRFVGDFWVNGEGRFEGDSL